MNVPYAPADVASRIDHTLLKPEATADDVRKLCDEAIEHGFASVCVNPVFLPVVLRKLEGSKVKACVVSSFPLGANKPSLKSIEATSCAKDGAQEIDFVAHLPALLACDLDAAREDFLSVTVPVREVRSAIMVKVILETSTLMHGIDPDLAEKRIHIACQAAAEAGCDFVKTSTGFHPTGGATAQSVSLLRKHAPKLQVKASGGIRSWGDAVAMLNAGADRLGCSAGVAIVKGGKGTSSY